LVAELDRGVHEAWQAAVAETQWEHAEGGEFERECSEA